MKLNIKHKILLTIACCSVFTLFVAGCSKLPYTFAKPPTSDSESSEAESDEQLTPALALIIDGKEIGYVDASTTEDELALSLTNEKQAELESIGYDVKSVTLDSDISLTSSTAKADAVISADEVLSELRSSSPKFTYILTEKETVAIAFETVNKNSSSHLEGTKVVQTEGKDGKKELTYESVYKDDSLVSKTKVNEVTVSAPQNKVVLIGTKKSTASTGKYIYPLKSVYITSYYGSRTLNGKYDFHYGIDLRAANGTSVMASDGGKVIYAGSMGSYGTLIKIEHDNGNVTYYAHLSSLSVKVGERVYQGQVIAKSGSTGNVTGPHLHFEIRINGTHKNPLLFL